MSVKSVTKECDLAVNSKDIRSKAVKYNAPCGNTSHTHKRDSMWECCLCTAPDL